MGKIEGTYTVVGPPGTGKTTWLGAQVRSCVDAGQRVLVASLTKAAAAEVAGRGLPIPPDAVGTLHSHAWRALGRPCVYGRDEVDVWNRRHLAWQQTPPKRRLDDPGDRGEPTLLGDQLREASDLYRHKLVEPDDMPPDVRRFTLAWTEFRGEQGVVDFTDMVRLGCDVQPPDADVILVDEAQDQSPLLVELVEHWATACRQLAWVGDADQCHPPGVSIETRIAKGKCHGWSAYKPIEQLDPNVDCVRGWSRRSQQMVGGRRLSSVCSARRRLASDRASERVSGGKRPIVVRWRSRPQTTTKVFEPPCDTLTPKDRRF